MKIILQKDVANLGDAGEVREVANGYARNFLIPKKLAIPAHTGSTKALEHQKKLVNLKSEKRNKAMVELSQKLQSLGTVNVAVRVGKKNKLFGSVTSMDVANALKEAGFAVDKRKVELGEPIKALGNFKVKIRLADKILVNLGINVVPEESSLAEVMAIEEEERAVHEAFASQQARIKAKDAEEEAAAG